MVPGMGGEGAGEYAMDEEEGSFLDDAAMYVNMQIKPAAVAAAAAAAAAAADDDEDDDEGGFGLDLFDGGDETAALLGDGTVDDKFKLTTSPLFPPATIAAPTIAPMGKKGKKGVAAPSKIETVETVAPKAWGSLRTTTRTQYETQLTFSVDANIDVRIRYAVDRSSYEHEPWARLWIFFFERRSNRHSG
jgi:hypothetical protein